MICWFLLKSDIKNLQTKMIAKDKNILAIYTVGGGGGRGGAKICVHKARKKISVGAGLFY